MNRRNALIVLSGTAAIPAALGASPTSDPQPWYARMRRCGQTNFNERDPIEIDIGWWIDYWASLKVDALLVGAGGITAFYPTEIPYHHRSRFLGSRDLFGEFARAAKAKGIRVVARLDCNWVFEDAVKAHPEWVARTAAGEPVRNAEAPELFQTCMYSSYFTEQMPAIIGELNWHYDIDGFFTNGWPSTTPPPPCQCGECRGAPDPASPAGYEYHLARVIAVWKLWDETAKHRKPDSVYVGNLGGGIRAVLDLRRVAAVAGWFNADHQGRSGDTPIWDCAQQGRVARSVMKGRTVTNVTGAYANSSVLWRHSSKAPLEMTVWLAQTTASGMTPWFHWLGGKPRDLRWMEPGRRFFQWMAANDAHLACRESVASVAVLFSERTNAFYKPPGGGHFTDSMQGMYNALLHARVLFDFVHEDDLSAETLRRYRALVLPNAAVLKETQCAQLRDYAARGGSLLATFETGFFDESGNRRAQSGLADLFGLRAIGDRVPPTRQGAYARIERQHPILDGFSGTEILPFAEYYVPLAPVADPVLTVIPPYPAFPPEMVYPRQPRTDQPAAIAVERDRSRLVWLAGDVDRAYWRSQDPDLSRLLGNCIRWIVRDASPVEVSGAGLLELFAWKTDSGYALHLLNYTNPDMQRGWFTEAQAAGPQRVRFRVPGTVSRVRLLHAGVDMPFTTAGGTVEFTIPQLIDYEVAALIG
ncbi:MAG TPA: alpha-amylase family protein [Bryobacteraceae bacterium]|nr:alpha-amylase family protein [Bryobacteraceae bacterium]